MKHLYTLIVMAGTLRPYFNTHTNTVLTNEPLKHFLQKARLSTRMVKLVVHLSEFKI